MTLRDLIIDDLIEYKFIHKTHNQINFKDEAKLASYLNALNDKELLELYKQATIVEFKQR